MKSRDIPPIVLTATDPEQVEFLKRILAMSEPFPNEPELDKKWKTVNDARTRHNHGRAQAARFLPDPASKELKFGRTAKKLRLDLGLTQAEMADLLEVPAASVGDLENDNIKITDRYLVAYRRAFGIDLYVFAWLEFGDIEKLPERVRASSAALARAWSTHVREAIATFKGIRAAGQAALTLTSPLEIPSEPEEGEHAYTLPEPPNPFQNRCPIIPWDPKGKTDAKPNDPGSGPGRSGETPPGLDG